MFLEYRKNELKQQDFFNEVYNKLKNNSTVLMLVTAQPVKTNKDIAIAGRVAYNSNDLFVWNHFGSSANKATKTGFKFIIDKICDDCEYFTIIDGAQYIERTSAYYNTEFERHQQESEE